MIFKNLTEWTYAQYPIHAMSMANWFQDDGFGNPVEASESLNEFVEEFIYENFHQLARIAETFKKLLTTQLVRVE